MGKFYPELLCLLKCFRFIFQVHPHSGESVQISSEGSEKKGNKKKWEWCGLLSRKDEHSAFSGPTVTSPETSHAFQQKPPGLRSSRCLQKRTMWAGGRKEAGVVLQELQTSGSSLALKRDLGGQPPDSASAPCVSVSLCPNTVNAGNSPLFKSFDNLRGAGKFFH